MSILHTRGYRPREEMRGRRIRGVWPDGSEATATWDDYDEFIDDRFGDPVDFPERLIGGLARDVREAAAGTFWDGVEHVGWVK